MSAESLGANCICACKCHMKTNNRSHICVDCLNLGHTGTRKWTRVPKPRQLTDHQIDQILKNRRRLLEKAATV